MTNEQLENRAAWTAALRSGEYKQAFEKLCNGTGYCCLGVGCLVVRARGIGVSDDFLNNASDLEGFNRDSGGAPVIEALGLSRLEHEALTVANDKGNTFEVIADMIDARTAGEP